MTGGQSADSSAWADAFARLSAADRESSLAPEDLERLAVAGYLVGRDEVHQDALSRAYQEWVHRREPARAARCAFWLAFRFLLRGDGAQGGGWLAHARRLVDSGDRDCVERGYLLVPDALSALSSGDGKGAYDAFGDGLAIGERFGDPDLTALCELGRGQALIRLGRTTAGLAALDEVMATVTAGAVSPIVTGVAYCAMVFECQRLFDVRRAREWTLALSRWCRSQPDRVPYRGQCLVHRSEIMLLSGDWPDALRQAREACERLSGEPAAGMAYYQLAELHRLRGEFDSAEEAYRQANRSGRSPQPGLALLRLAQGQIDAAAAAIGRVMQETADPVSRAHLLGASVEVSLAEGELTGARGAAEELFELAETLDAGVLHAVAAHAMAAVHLAEGDARAALSESRRAWSTWRELDAPHGAACARVLIGVACRQLGDEDGATMEFDAATWVLQQLGAEPDLARVERLMRTAAPRRAGELSAREREVLALVAAGRTNRQIATELLVSEHTIRRHLQNIFVKLDVPSRAAATAYALRHKLI
jgi:DNA-binding CsgD family transcriptional regulator